MEGEAPDVVVKKSDLSTEMDTAAPALEARAAAGDLDGAIEALFLLEKRCRMVRATPPAPTHPPPPFPHWGMGGRPRAS